jgi:hypothetical protein
MLNNFIKKSVICGIILLFLGVSFSSSISGTSNDESTNANVTNSPLNDYVLAYWKLDTGSGNTAYDSSGHDFDGTINGATWVTGKYGKALSFDGLNDYVEFDDYSEDLGINKTDDLIYSIWFKSESTEDGLIYSASDKWGISNPELSIQLCANGSLLFKIWTQYCGIQLYSDKTYNNNNWRHLELFFNGISANPTVTIYVDGIFDNNLTEWLCPIASNEFSLTKMGRRAFDETKHFEGSIDDFKIIKYPGGNKQEPPIIEGPTEGLPGVEYEYTFTLNDPEEDEVEFLIDWDDGTKEYWRGPYTSGTKVTVSHTWDEDDRYNLRAKSRDIWDDSHWSEYVVKIGNQPPEPPTIDGPKHGDTQQQLTYTFVAIDEEDEDVNYSIDWDDGTTTEIGYHESGETVTAEHSWNTNKEYNITAQAFDIHGKPGEWSKYHIRIGDQPPTMQGIYGAVNGYPDIEYEYGFIATDPEDDNLSYEIDWGDGNIETDIGPFPSGEIFPRSHTWTKSGTYQIKARAKDIFDYYGAWSEHEIIVPRNKAFNFNLLDLLFERFPRALPILRNLIGLLKYDNILLEDLEL